MDAAGLHPREQVDHRHRRRHEQHLADDLGGGKRRREIDRLEIETGRERLLALGVGLGARRGARGHVGDQVADVHHADRIVERVVVDDEPRMRGAFEHLHQLAERDLLLHRDDVGARHHHVDRAPLAQAEDVPQHRAFARREPDIAGAVLEHAAKVGAERVRLPAEQRPQRAREPAFAVRRVRRLSPPAPAPAGCGCRPRADRLSPKNLGWTNSDLGDRCRAWRDQMSALGLAHHVGIGNADARKNGALEPFHFLGVVVRFVIVAQEMEKAMDRQVGDMVAERLVLGGGLAGRGLVGNRDVAEGACRDRAGYRGRGTTARWSACRSRARAG